MGAVFALFSAWYFWIPKILGLDYNKMLGKVHFWILFIGVLVKEKSFDLLAASNIKYSNSKKSNYNSPYDFVMYFYNVKALASHKKEIYNNLRNKSWVSLLIM